IHASLAAATAHGATTTPGPGPERSTHPGRMSRPCGARIRIVTGSSQLILLRAYDRRVLSTPVMLQHGSLPAPLHTRAIPVPSLKAGTVTAQSIAREGPSATQQCGGPAPCQQGRADRLSGVSR